MKRTAATLTLAALACLAGIPAGAAQRDGAVIQNSGSTNVPGFTIKIWSDGSAWSVPLRHGTAAGAPATGTVPAQLTAKFFEDVRAAKRTGQLAVKHCAKSASFGTSMTMTYHGWTSPDVTCPGDAQVIALAADANQIAAALNLPGHGMRSTPMLPNEHRRPPVEGRPPAQASASPEPSPSAS